MFENLHLCYLFYAPDPGISDHMIYRVSRIRFKPIIDDKRRRNSFSKIRRLFFRADKRRKLLAKIKFSRDGF